LSRSAPPLGQSEGPYRLQFKDEANNLLYEIPFSPFEIIGDEGDPHYGIFFNTVIAESDISKVSVVFEGKVLASRSKSQNTPTVEVLYPNGGENLSSDPVVVQWKGRDMDGDKLSFIVRYSADAGASWETIALEWPNESYEVSLGELKGTSQGIIQVIASDGFHSTKDESDKVFSVPNSSPQILKTTPNGNPLHTGDKLIFLKVDTYDSEDSEIPDSNIKWESNIFAEQIAGNNLAFRASDLPEGDHLATVTVVDSGGLSASETVKFRVLREVPALISDLAVDKKSASNVAASGCQISYTFSVENNGPDDATAVVFTNYLSQNVNFVSAISTQGTCMEEAGTVNCDLGIVPRDTISEITINTISSAEGTAVNAASVTGDQTDPFMGNNQATNEITITPRVPGDLNGIGGVTLTDAIIALQILSGNEPTPICSPGADIGSDNKVDNEEAVYILQSISGLR